MQFWHIIIAVVSGLIVCVPLAFWLVQKTQEAANKGQWFQIVSKVAAFMTDAERLIGDGDTRKEWVLGMVQAATSELDYPIMENDMKKISDMIDCLADMASMVNVKNKGTVKNEM